MTNLEKLHSIIYNSRDVREKLPEDEYRHIAASGDWAQPQPPARNDATMYNDWD